MSNGHSSVADLEFFYSVQDNPKATVPDVRVVNAQEDQVIQKGSEHPESND